jgi:hypothetical protein
LLGTGTFEGSPEEFVRTARVDAKTWFVKTHLPHDVQDTEKVLYPVRDARAAMASYRRFQRDVNGFDFTLDDIVHGKPPLESWSEHVAWAISRPRDRTLLLRYEELANLPRAVLDAISAFTGLPILADTIRPFSEIKNLQPAIAGVGHDGLGIAAVEAHCSDLFWQTHGDAMRALGYA